MLAEVGAKENEQMIYTSNSVHLSRFLLGIMPKTSAIIAIVIKTESPNNERDEPNHIDRVRLIAPVPMKYVFMFFREIICSNGSAQNLS
jgi:hypothetical protein